MQLLVLSGVHFLIDMFGGMLPAILPAIMSEFGLRLSLAGIILGVLHMTSNGFQVLTGHMRARKRIPLFLHVGLILAAGICLLGFLPRGLRWRKADSWGSPRAHATFCSYSVVSVS